MKSTLVVVALVIAVSGLAGCGSSASGTVSSGSAASSAKPPSYAGAPSASSASYQKFAADLPPSVLQSLKAGLAQPSQARSWINGLIGPACGVLSGANNPAGGLKIELQTINLGGVNDVTLTPIQFAAILRAGQSSGVCK